MGVLKAFRLSLLLPKKRIVFQLNRVKTKDFFMYIVGLHLLIALPNGIRMVTDSVNRGAFISEFLLILFLYPIFIIMFGITSISVNASDSFYHCLFGGMASLYPEAQNYSA